MNKQQLAAKIWESANRMRSKIEANEYKDYILGFIFYKFLSEKEYHWLLNNDYEPEDIKNYVNEDDLETLKNVQQSLGYFIAYENLFSTWIKIGSDFSIDNVRIALSSFKRLISPSHKKVFDGIFETLETGLSKLGTTTREQTKSVSDLIALINEIPMNNKQDYDTLGFIYEYLISNFASNAGKKAGEFYTPHEVSLLMSEIVANHLKGQSEIKIYDPTSGSGSLLINIGRSISKYMDDPNRIRYYAQELKSNTYNLTRMNLVMRGILPDNIIVRNADTLEDDWPFFDDSDKAGTYDPLYLDAVVSNPPYSQRWNPEGKENDPRYADYGLAPQSKADYAFLLHDLFHVKPGGIMTIVLPHGVLFRGGEEGQIRKRLIEKNKIDAIIGLPANIFYGTGIPTIIMVLKQKREDTNVLIIDASKGFIKEGKNNKLRASDIKRIVDVIVSRKDVDKFSRNVSREEIRSNDYNLNIPRYVDSSEKTETYDIYASMFGGIPENELSDFQQYWDVFPTLKNALFIGEGNYKNLRDKDIKHIIHENADVQAFIDQFKHSFSDFENELEDVLINQVETLSISKTEDFLAKDLFKKFENVPLLDAYEAYEIFENQYQKIEGDLELIQAEGKQAIRVVDPNMVVKKKKDKEVEIQEGWKGHVLPFDLIQNLYLKEELQSLKDKQDELSSIPSQLEELIDALNEDDKDTISEALNETNDAFVDKNISKVIKSLNTDPESKPLVEVLQKASKLNKQEKALKKEIKQDEDTLHLETKNTIESLTDAQLLTALKAKWITPIIDNINSLPVTMIDNLTKEMNTLADKYAVTLNDIENDIKKTYRGRWKSNTVTLLIGGNQGDRVSLLMRAIIEISQQVGTVAVVSPIFETEPWGFDAEQNFLNQALVVDTDLTAIEVLHKALEIERQLGRRREDVSGGEIPHTEEKHYASRPIDIDLIFYNNDIVETPELTLPHQRMHQRRFVLEPLARIMPFKKHPKLGKTVQQLLDECEDGGVVKEYF